MKTANWEMLEQRLKQERREKLPSIDTSEAIKSFDRAWQVARRSAKVSRESGLVEQQTLFAKLR